MRADAKYVAGVEIENGILFDVRILNTRRAIRILVLVQVIQKSAHVLRGEITFQGPRCVGVADGEGEVGNIAKHQSFVIARR